MAVNQVQAPNDNAAGGMTAGLSGATSQFQNSEDSSQPNVLDQYASYTYNISWYLLTPDDIKRMMRSGSIKSIPSDQLIVNTGGISAQSRNKNFDVDFFIERMTIEFGLSGKHTNVATTATSLKMTVTEPYGISFVQRLQRSVNELYGVGTGNPQTGSSGGNQSQSAVGPMDAFNLIVVRFYGYDEAGNLVRTGKNDSIVEKYYQVKIQKLEYKVSVKQIIEYEIEFQIQQDLGQQMRAVIPKPIEIGGATVRDVLAGPASAKPAGDGRQSSARPSPTASKAPPKAGSAQQQNSSTRTSLAQILNSLEQDQVKNGVYTYPDEFAVEFVDEKIASAKVTVKDGTNKGTGSPANATAAEKVNSDKQKVANTIRNFGFTAGLSTVQVIDEVIRNSTYITDQANRKVSEKTGQQTPNAPTGAGLVWYKINMLAEPQKWDPKRNDHNYKFTYKISPYRVSEIKSQYFDKADSPGIHKRYDYMFTGKNTQVLEWELKLNNQFTTFMTQSQNAANNTANANTFLPTNTKPMFAAASGASRQGAGGKTNEIGASANDYLYDPNSMGYMEFTIMGDPAWMLQGAMWQLDAAISSPDAPFLPDGTINSDVSEILCELVINTPTDYDLSTGLMDPNKRPTLYRTENSAAPGMSAQSYVLRATTVTCDFNSGKFTQRLKTQMVQYNPDQTVRQGAGRGQ